MRIPLYILISCGFFGLLAACESHQDDNTNTPSPVTLTKVAGSPFNTVTLSQEAAHRIGIQLTPMTNQIPYSAIIYGLHGETWVYKLVKPLTFVRMPVVIDHITGQVAVLSSAPPPNTQIVSIGATELYGSEYIGNIEP